MPDPITDLQKGVPDAELKKRYKISDEDLFTLRKYDYATTKGGLKTDEALEIYPQLTKYISRQPAVITPNDPISDIKSGASEQQLKKKYSLNDDDVFLLRKYDYATSEGGLSQDQALKLYPNASKFIGSPKGASKQGTLENVSNSTPAYRGSMLPDINTPKPASESTSVNQPSQTLDKLKTDIRNEPQKISDQQALVAGENIMRNTQIGEAQNRMSKTTGIPSNLQPIKQPIVVAPEVPSFSQATPYDIAKQKETAQAQKSTDEFYKTDVGKAYYNLVQPLIKTTTETGAKIVAGAVRLGGDVAGIVGASGGKESADVIANKMVDYFDYDRASKNAGANGAVFGKPTKLQGGMVHDGHFNTAALIPSTIENLTSMAMLLGGGEALGGGKAKLIASSYLNTVENYRKDGAAAGLKGGQLDAFSNVAAGLTSYLETISPNNPIVGKFKKTLLKEATKNIAEGISVNASVKRAAKEFFKENGKEVAQELSQNIGDHIVKAASDELTDKPHFNEDLSYGKMRDEVAETVLMTVLPTTLLMAPNTIHHFKPSQQVQSSMQYAATHLDEFYKGVDKATADGTFTPEQSQEMKDNIGKYSTVLNNVKKTGVSDDQANRIAWATYKDSKITADTKAIADNPILKETIGKEVEKERNVLRNDILDAAKGIPEVGTEVSGEELSGIAANVPSAPKAMVERLKDNNYRVEEINLQDKYDNESVFKKSVDEFEKSKEDPEGLRTPAIVDTEGNVLDGNKRLVQQYVNGEKTARVFKQLRTDTNQVDYSNQFEIPEATPEELVKAEAEVNQSLTPDTFTIPDEETANWVKDIHNDLENGKIQEPQTNIKEQTTNSGGVEQVVTGEAGSSDKINIPENGTTGLAPTENQAIDFEAPLAKDHAKMIADKLRSWAKVVEGDTTLAKSDLLALPKAIVSTALKGAALIIEGGGTVAKAISHAVEVIREHYEKNNLEFDSKQVKDHVKDVFKSAGIIPTSEKATVKETIRKNTSTVVKDTVMDNEISALKRQIKDKFKNMATGEMEGLAKGKSAGFVKGMITGFQKGMKEGSGSATRAHKIFEEHTTQLKQNINAMLMDAEKRRVFSGETRAALVSSIAKKLNSAKSPVQLLRAMEHVAKVIDNVQYDKDYNQAVSLKTKIAKIIKGKTLDRSASNIATVKGFLKLKPDDVQDIKQYNDIAQKILNTQKGAMVKVVEGRGTVVNESHEVANKEIKDYTEGELTHGEELAKDRTAENYQDLVDMGVIDSKAMSLKEMQDIIKAVNDGGETMDEKLALSKAETDEKKRAMTDMISYQQTALDEHYKSIKDLDVLSPEEHDLIEKAIAIDPADLDIKQMVKLNDVINNIVVNGEFFGAGEVAVLHDVLRDNKIMVQKIKASGIDLQKFNELWYGKLVKGVASIHLIHDFIFKSSKLAAEIQRLSGITDIFSKHAVASVKQQRVIKEYQDLKAKMGNKIDSSENRYRRGVYAKVIQNLGGTPEEMKAEFDRVKLSVKHSYEKLQASDIKKEKQEGDLVERVYKEILDNSETAEDVRAALGKLEPNNIKLADFWENKYNETADQVKSSSEIYNNKILDRYNHYTATKAKPINGETISGEQEDIFKSQVLSKKLDATPAKTKMNRIKSSVLPTNIVYDFDFDAVQPQRYFETIYDLETAPAIAKVRAFFDSDASKTLLGGSQNRQMVMDSMKNAVLAQKNKKPPIPDLEKVVSKIVNVFQAKGARIALGSLSQLPKQYISVAASTIVNLGKNMPLYFKALAISNNIKLFDQSSIAMRGDTKAGYNHGADIAAISRTELGGNIHQAGQAILTLGKKLGESAMATLTRSDVSVARTSWLAYYMQDLTKQRYRYQRH